MDTVAADTLTLDDTERADLRAALSERRAAVVDRWARAVARGGLFAAGQQQARATVEALTEATIELLLAEPFDARPGEELGRTIATVAYNHADALAETHILLYSLLDEMPERYAPGLRRRLVALLGRLAAGFTRRGREMQIGEQEVTRAAYDAQRARTEGALRASEERLRAVLANAPVVLFTLDCDGVVTLSEGQALHRLGGIPGEAVGQPLLAVPHTPPQVVRNLERALTGESFSDVVAVNGLSYETRYAPLRERDGTISGLIGVAVDITDRVRAERALAQARRRIANRREDERRTLVHELHDGVVQRLLGLSYLLANLEVPAAEGGVPLPPRVAQAVGAVRRELLDAAAQVRQVITELRPAALDQFGLFAALDGYVARLRRESPPGSPTISMHFDGDDTDLSRPIADCLFRVTQEALRNATRHAAAQEVAVALHLTPRHATVRIQDDGRGMEAPPHWEALTRDAHFGLLGMRERVQDLDGTLEVASTPGAGTTVVVQLPLDAPDEEQHDPRDSRAARG